jgi:hypothetical protein
MVDFLPYEIREDIDQLVSSPKPAIAPSSLLLQREARDHLWAICFLLIRWASSSSYFFF